MDTVDIINSFVDSMIKDGCAPAKPSEIVADGEDHYITLEGDLKAGRLSACLTIMPSGYAKGNYYNYKTSAHGKWTSYKPSTISKEDRKKIEEEYKLFKDERIRKQKEKYRTAAIEARKTWDSASEVTEHPYLSAKKIKNYGLKILDGDLLVPLTHEGAISTYQTISATGEKYYLAGGQKRGAYFKISGNHDVICIAEGYSTAASIHEATKFTTYAAMDAGNLKEVAGTVKSLHPSSLIILCADNDQWSTNQRGQFQNTGIEAARQAAGIIGAHICYPDFPQDDIDLRTDFNDLHTSVGLAAVASKIMEVVDAQTKPTEQVSSLVNEEGKIDWTGDMGMPFKILGFDNGVYYYFPFGVQHICKFPASAHTMNNLIQLASIDEWKRWARENYEERMDLRSIPIYALDSLKRIAERRGVFKEEDRVRGCGTWRDAGRIILHCGDRLLVDGVLTAPRDISGHYVYPSAAQRFKHHSDPLENSQAKKLIEICCSPKWENPLSGKLLAGWLVIAPVCGALDWRPHIWLRGEPGSGKTTILNEVVKRVLVDISLNVEGGTTESSIRGDIGYDARPVIYDEAEPHPSMDGVVRLAKSCSRPTGKVGKRGQVGFAARSSFCFACVNPSIKDLAAESRITMLDLVKNVAENADVQFQSLTKLIVETLTPDYSRRMLARTVQNLKLLLKNTETFKIAAQRELRDARSADQISGMLAGYYLLKEVREITLQEAIDVIKSETWEDHTTVGAEKEHDRLFHYLATSVVNVKGDRTKDLTLGHVICCALGKSSDITADQAKLTLRQYSILARADGVFIGNKNHNLSRLLKKTDWENGWSKTIQRIPGARSVTNQYYGPADTQRSSCLPPELFYSQTVEVKPVARLVYNRDEENDEYEIPFN